MKRWLVMALGSIIVLALVAAAVIYWLLSGDGIRRALERQASAWLGEPVRIGAARAQLFPRIGIQLSDVEAGEPARITLRRVAISAALRPLLSRRIEDADVTLSDSRVELPLPFVLPEDEPPAPGAPAEGESSPDAGAGVQLVSIRAITLRDIVVASRGREIEVSADSSLAGSRLTIERFTASSGSTDLEASGVVELEPRLDAQLTVSANQLDVDEMLALAHAFSPPSQASARAAGRTPGVARAAATQAAPPARISADITAQRARVGDLEVRNFATMLLNEGERLSLSPLTLELFDGRYEGTITGTMGQRMAATIKSQLTGLDVAQLAAFGGAAGTVTGRLSATGTFTGQGADVAAALAAARGSGTAEIVDGTVARLNLIRTIVLFFGRPAPDAGESSDRFERIDLRFSLANQIVRADAFSFQSADVDVTGTGSLALPTKALDGSLTLALSEALSAQAGTDLVRFTREGNRVVLPARLGGTLESPRVTIDAKAAVTRGIRNEAERQLKGVLEGLLK
jgi:uncharacterized protein involved in outer membrane biogenesis